MRILGLSKKWPKLQQDRFTTFRFTRKDKDWFVGEQVQVVYKPRSKDREVLGIATITQTEPRNMVKLFADRPEYPFNLPLISDTEVVDDGFADYWQMWYWLFDAYGGGRRFLSEPMNKLALKWIERYD